jgi:hypothetical protein
MKTLLNWTWILIMLLMLFFSFKMAFATSYYIDSVGGDDSDNGTSQDSAWKTVAKVNVANFSPGDYVLFKRGGSWREQLNISCTGNSSDSILFSGYGSGSNPLIIRSELFNGTWENHSINASHSIYRFATSMFSRGITDDGLRKADVYVGSAGANNTLNDNTTGYRLGYLYYRKDIGDIGVVEYGARTHGIYFFNASYVILDGIDAQGTGGSVGYSDKSNLIFVSQLSHDITIQNSILHISNQACLYTNKTSNYRIVNVTTYDCATTGIFVSGNGYVLNSTVYNVGNLEDDSGDLGGIGLHDGPAVIDGNEVYNNGHNTTSADYSISVWGPNCSVNVTRNYIHDIGTGGIQYAVPNDSKVAETHYVAYNIIRNYGYTDVEMLDGKSAAISLNHYNISVFNNLILDGGNNIYSAGIYVRYNASNLNISNNLLYNNTKPDIKFHRNASITFFDTIFCDYNIFYRVGAGSWYLNGTTVTTLAAWQNASGKDNNSLFSDPNFVSSSNYHLLINSPALNTGLNTGFLFDFENNPVPSGGLYDIGAYEYQYVTTPTTSGGGGNIIIPTNQSNITCNGNGVCEVENGENILSCLVDCKGKSVDEFGITNIILVLIVGFVIIKSGYFKLPDKGVNLILGIGLIFFLLLKFFSEGGFSYFKENVLITIILLFIIFKLFSSGKRG